MARPLDLSKSDDRLAIDFAISNGASNAAIAAAFDVNIRTLAFYARRMREADSRYFNRLRITGTPRADDAIIAAARYYAEKVRQELLNAALSVFANHR
ncbi:hypothetical protein CWB41_15900 [Methylovirgula ligni]|uniref:Uncharacterized protein n=1 Tax=Methylovirgula ligni TaxID=569860 RepID=A0A3D9YZS9_9HYPH|nr:hypothetical protein [Methylovirgula ligni]QAY97036.1 hypothetical protein CWB41_15900 [Methylovirgula ligni]REF87895.1 hypothetical protein DES32_1532 [Methylovirgula ligni]